MNYENRQFIIFNQSELNKIDFNQVLETSVNTIRTSIDGTKTFVKWEGEMPECVASLTTKEGPYTHEQMLNILATDVWTDNNIQP